MERKHSPMNLYRAKREYRRRGRRRSVGKGREWMMDAVGRREWTKTGLLIDESINQIARDPAGPTWKGREDNGRAREADLSSKGIALLGRVSWGGKTKTVSDCLRLYLGCIVNLDDKSWSWGARADIIAHWNCGHDTVALMSRGVMRDRKYCQLFNLQPYAILRLHGISVVDAQVCSSLAASIRALSGRPSIYLAY